MLITFALASAAAIAVQPAHPAPIRELVRHLKVYAKAAPKPALRYALLPELKELTPGNPILGYFNAYMDQDFGIEKEVIGLAGLRQVDRAARMDRLDWQVHIKRSDEDKDIKLDIYIPLMLAKALQKRIQAEIASKRFDDAIATAKTIFAMARHTNDHPTLSGKLIATAIGVIAIRSLQDMAAQPGSPNLYWALSRLPNPLTSLFNAMEGLRMEFDREMNDLRANSPMSEQQIAKLADRIDKLRSERKFETKKPLALELVKLLVSNPGKVRSARGRLLKYGIEEELLDKLPAEQIVLLDEKFAFEVRRDEFFKLMVLPFWQIEEQARKLEVTRADVIFESFLNETLLLRYCRDFAEGQQEMALLVHIEALRLYAGEHKGNLPEKLSDIGLPLPLDPLAGKPFQYAREANVAHLRTNPPPASDDSPKAALRHYEITVLQP